MKALKHLGKQPLAFVFDAYVCDVRGLPSDVSSIAISWERSNGCAAYELKTTSPFLGASQQ